MGDRGYGHITLGGVILEEHVEGLCRELTNAGAFLGYGSDQFFLEEGGKDSELYHQGSFAPRTAEQLIRAAELCNGHIVISDPEANGGMFDDLEDFCKTNNIDFDRHSDSLYDWDASNLYFRKELGAKEMQADNNNYDVVHTSVLEEVLTLLETHQRSEAIAKLKENILQFPPIQIVSIKMSDGRVLTPKIEAIEPSEDA